MKFRRGFCTFIIAVCKVDGRKKDEVQLLVKENNGSGRRANYITHTYCMHRVHNEDEISMNVEKGSCYLCGLNCTHTCGMIRTSSSTIMLYIVANASHCFPWRYRNGNRDIGTTYTTACFLHYT